MRWPLLVLATVILAIYSSAIDDYRRLRQKDSTSLRHKIVTVHRQRGDDGYDSADRIDALMRWALQDKDQWSGQEKLAQPQMTLTLSAKRSTEGKYSLNDFLPNPEIDSTVSIIPYGLQEEDQSKSESQEDSEAFVEKPQLQLRYRLVPKADVLKRNVKRPYLKHTCLKKTGKIYEHRSYPRSFEHAGFEATLPREWDWRNVSGVNYCSPNRNQHIPVYCGSCWVFGALGALNDRFNIARKNRWPMTVLSPQEIIACGGKGSCNGGEPGGVYEYAKTDGLVEEGCNNYKAVNEQCDAFSRCGSCWPDNCFAISNYTRYRVKDYGVVRGRLAMMEEIYNRGPIACSIGATEPFEFNYTSGIYAELSDLPSNHIVAVTGWGYDEETKTEYWIVRNSWGDAWGERGWFRAVTSIYRNGRGDQYNMGIERECYFADPDVSNLT